MYIATCGSAECNNFLGWVWEELNSVNKIYFEGAGPHIIRIIILRVKLDMRLIQSQGETLPPFPLVLAFHLVLGKFHLTLYPLLKNSTRASCS